jgi:acyl-CoA thioester hydrolase
MIHEIEARVYYEDTDAGRVMYYPNHLKFCERGRTEFLRHLGYQNSDLFDQNGILFVVRRVEAEYFSPARLDDHLRIRTALKTVKNTSFVMQQELYRSADKIFSMNVLMVCINEAGKPVGLPEDLKEKFLKYVI